MNILVPQNIFAQFPFYSLKSKPLPAVNSRPASLISHLLENKEADVALIPSLDLLSHGDFFVSSRLGISFDGELCSSFLYFVEGKKNISKLLLNGEVTANETLAAKLIFEEFYNTNVELSLDLNEPAIEKNNYLICGNKNFQQNFFNKGISLAEQLSELLGYPYVNFVFASNSRDKIKEFNSLLENTDLKIEENIDDLLANLKITESAKDFIKNNLNSVYFEITQNEIDGLSELLKYAYFKGMVDDIVEIKWIA